ncbi:MAG TPA: hypothetical protein VLA13_09460, partial [Massilibacterium sp.]|nr:hypothetical protein [Massilibacterium sp.]
SVFYRVCNCNTEVGIAISHINFELCEGGILPVQAIVNGEEGTITDGDEIFGVPNFKVENFGDINDGECVTFQLVYNAEFGIESLVEGLFGVKVGGGPTSPLTTGFVEGLLVPCVTVLGCTQDVTAEICSEATVSLTPLVTPGTPIVSCVNGPLINTSCTELPGFTPLLDTGECTFTVSQVICATIPLDFSVDVNAVPSGGACGPVVPGTDCPLASALKISEILIQSSCFTKKLHELGS